MAAFRKLATGRGRVQFVWVGQVASDVNKAHSCKDLDKYPWFYETILAEKMSNELHIVTDRELPKIECSCGEWSQ